jgi:redox-sensing transcriptional repressor
VILDPSVPRLYAYHRALREAQAAGEVTITSEGLAQLLGRTVSSTQIRKDLSLLGPLGRRGYGYAINPLMEQLAWVLGLEHDWRLAIVGFGYLGHAFATFITAREARFRVVAIFDCSSTLVGQVWQGITVTDVVGMERTIAAAACNIGVLAVPASAAQECAARLAAAGVRAIMNFAPVRLRLRSPVLVRNVDLAGEMSILTHHLTSDVITMAAKETA